MNQTQIDAAIDVVRQKMIERRRLTESLDLLTGGKPKVKLALEMARSAHQLQKRKFTGDPYIDHPIEVAKILVQHKLATERHLIAALLHDTVEDTNITAHTIGHNFSQTAGLDVEALTITKSMGNRKRRVELNGSMALARGPVTVAVRIADIISNTRDVALHDPKFAELYLAEKKIVLDMFARATMPEELRPLLTTAYDIHGEALNQLALTILAEGNDREAKDAAVVDEITAIIAKEQMEGFAEIALF